MSSMPVGSVTVTSLEQPSKALVPIEVTPVPLKVRVASFEQPEKQVAGIEVTEALMVAEVNDAQPLKAP